MGRHRSSASRDSAARDPSGETFRAVLARRFARRALLKGGALAPLLAIGSVRALVGHEAEANLTFGSIAGGTEDEVRVPDGYVSEALASWGDRLSARASRFDPSDLDPAAQRGQVGYNCGYLGWVDYQPLLGGIVCIGHNDTNPELMFSDYAPERTTLREVDYELASLGVTVFQAPPRRSSEAPKFWFYESSNYNERLHGESSLSLTGPVAGHSLLVTSTDSGGTKATGTFNACGGGVSPWGTFLVAEGDFGQYFANNGSVPNEMARAANASLGIQEEESGRPWWGFHQRFDLAHEPNEANKFGWIVEVDPWDRNWPRRKLTALGRFNHGSASVGVSPADRLAVYSVDASPLGCVYKFVSTDSFVRSNRSAARDLLDEGTLYAAKFNDDGTGEWLPLLYENGPLNASNGFTSQAEVLLFPDQAGELLGATRMDSPRDIQVRPAGDKAYLSLRGTDGPSPDAGTGETSASPVSLGQIIEIEEEGGDSAATQFSWQLFMQCGDPAIEDHGAYFAGFDTSRASSIARPGQIRFDHHGNLVIATEGQPPDLGIHDGVFCVPTEGDERGFNRQLLSGVAGAACGSALVNPAHELMLVGIHHPGKGGTREERVSTFGSDEINRPAVLAVTRSESPYRVGA